MTDRWRISVDTGGTFTDCIAVDTTGGTHRLKILSSSVLRAGVVRMVDRACVVIEHDWPMRCDLVRGVEVRVQKCAESIGRVASFDPDSDELRLDQDSHIDFVPGDAIELRFDSPAPLLAAHLVTQTPWGDLLPPISMRLATTRGTNALLERDVAPTALFVSRGFGDLLRIGDQQRTDLFSLNIIKPPPLYATVVEVDERMNAGGKIVVPLNRDALRADAKRAFDRGVCSAAVALLHSYKNAEHERAVEQILCDVGFEHVSCSSNLSSAIGFLERAQAAVVDAALKPTVRRYLDEIRSAIGPQSSLHVMTSAGALHDAERFAARDSLLSGPAGGVGGAAAAGRAAGVERLISFDMGGTSTDVARYDGEHEYAWTQTVGEVTLQNQTLAIETVAAGGGSICSVRDGQLCVGPESAGADPGPACYGAGGPLTLTDVNLLLERFDESQFPFQLDRDAALRALDDVCAKIGQAESRAVLLGFIAVADQHMAGGIERVSTRKGYDPTAYTLVAFGGAGGQHACGIADQLGMTDVLCPADASVLSAVGLQNATIERTATRQLLQLFKDVESRLWECFDVLDQKAVEEVVKEGMRRSDVAIQRRIAALRLFGQDATIDIDCEQGDDIPAEFRAKFIGMYGYPPPDRELEVESLRVIAAQQCVDSNNDASETDREIDGPALVATPRSSVFVAEGWRAEVNVDGAVRLRRVAARTAKNEQIEEVRTALFAHRLTIIADNMGQILQRCALSTNVKQRLDFSCAVLDADGRLVVNAPHIPVHLGAMGECVRSVRDAVRMRPGDVVVTNHPAYGGSHLPDVTVITPVFDNKKTLIGYVANRAHHAEIGGTRPGSMPPDATTLVEEGVILPPTHLVRAGESRFDDMEARLCGARYPSRAPNENIADLSAQVAANAHGADVLRTLCASTGRDVMQSHMKDLSMRSRRAICRWIATLDDFDATASEFLDDGSELRVLISTRCSNDESLITFDFTGTSTQHAGNLNATPAIVRAAVMYVVRVLCGEDVPLNEGMMDVVRIVLPPNCMLNPNFDVDECNLPAVVGGNVETSQRLVDVLLKPFGVVAASQGTMNNLLFGSDDFGYYETICGGAGAGEDFDGADAVHTHMTNTRITDPEIFEHRFPVRLRRFAVREGSGGSGAHRGGDGVVREIEFLEPVELSMLSQRRDSGPYGLNGANSGKPGRQCIVRSDGRREEMEGVASTVIHSGDRIVIETPGGGGFGASPVGSGA